MKISLLLLAAGLLLDSERVLDPALHHLGNDVVTDWTDVASEPEGMRLDVAFDAVENDREMTLSLAQRDVDDPWTVRLNGVEIGELERTKARVSRNFPVPPGVLRRGENVLSIAPSGKSTDDIVVGDVRLHPESFRERLGLRPVRVRVRDGESRRPIPARVTIVAADTGDLAPVYYASAATTAVRKGIVYTSAGEAVLELEPGAYRFHATRGMEWGLDTVERTMAADEEGGIVLDLSISREVDTRGYVAADTHVHTYTFSGHGDSTVEERLVTLAGEGVELAVATDHNHNTDYRPLQEEMRLHDHFTALTGNEVTTDVGHFNAFPLEPNGEVPPYKESDYVKLVDGMRAKGAKVVILNHPRWPKIETGPFGVFELDQRSGERSGGPERFTVDATELINSGTLQPDPFLIFRDWFALLNHGERISAVGSSDSHTVHEPVGQGRTYVPSATDDPSKIDVDAACEAFVRGRTSIALGIFTDVTVNEEHGIGSTVRVDDAVRVSLRVAAPAWVVPKTATVFLNGVAVAESGVPTEDRRPTDVRLRFSLEKPAHDAYLVCVVTGPPVVGPYWRIEGEYTLGATNPVFLDADGDGAYRSPRETAAAIVAKSGVEPFKLAAALKDADDSVAIQAAAIAREAYLAEASDKLRAIREALGDGHSGAKEYVRRRAEKDDPR